MGEIITVVAGVAEVAATIASLVSNANSTIQQVNSLTSGFGQITGGAPVSFFAAPEAGGNTGETGVISALKAAMAGAKNASTGAFKTQFPQSTASGTDYGVINNFFATGDPQTIVKQLIVDMEAWQLPVSEQAAGLLAVQMKTDVDAQIGNVGTNHGIYAINMNQSLIYTIAYGEFAITQTSNGLVYAFTAGLDSGWGAE